jgi:hypothetical protein
MKKVVASFLYFLQVSALCQQPAKKYSFYVEGGYMSSHYIKEARQKSIVSETESRHHRCIILNTGFQFSVSEKWRIGPAFTYDHFGTKHRSVEYSVLSYMLRGDRIWKQTGKFSLYSGLAIGVKTTKRLENEVVTGRSTGPGYHIYLIGADIKLYKFLVNVNAGWGVSGFVSIGMKYAF